MENVEIKKQISFVLLGYTDEDGNECELFQAYESGIKVYERDYKKPTKTFDECVHDYYDFNYNQYYYPPSNVSIS